MPFSLTFVLILNGYMCGMGFLYLPYIYGFEISYIPYYLLFIYQAYIMIHLVQSYPNTEELVQKDFFPNRKGIPKRDYRY